MKVATRRLLEEQLVVVAVLGSGKKRCHVACATP